MHENEIPKYKAIKKYKKKPIILEARYIGKRKELFDDGKWFTWKKYRNKKTADEAKKSLECKWLRFQFRVKY